MRNRPPILYFCSNGIGENIQASPAMRRLRLGYYVIMVCRTPAALVIHPDCYDELFTFSGEDWKAAIRVLTIAMAKVVSYPIPWTAHLDAYTPIREAFEKQRWIVEKLPRTAPRVPCSAALAFMVKVCGDPPIDEKDLLMHAAPPINGNACYYDVMVCMGSAEKMRRLPEPTAVELCNRFARKNLRVLLYGNGGRPDGLHSSINFVACRWNDATMEQMKEFVHGSRVLVSPDTGPVHLALAYGRKVWFLESREDSRAVIDPVHMPQVAVYRMQEPGCLQNCSARRPAFHDWPKLPNKAAQPGYPHNLECSECPQMPCLTLPPEAIDTIINHHFFN